MASAAKTTSGWWLGWNHFPGQSYPMLDNSFCEEFFLNIQSKPPLTQLEVISSLPDTCYLREENSHLTTTSFQVVAEVIRQTSCPWSRTILANHIKFLGAKGKEGAHKVVIWTWKDSSCSELGSALFIWDYDYSNKII